jgi:hypothetical protein
LEVTYGLQAERELRERRRGRTAWTIGRKQRPMEEEKIKEEKRGANLDRWIYIRATFIDGKMIFQSAEETDS